MHWELFSPLTTEAPESATALTALPEGLFYGYSVYTTFKMPLSEQVIDLHLQRLKKDCKALGLSWRFADHQILGQLKALFQPSRPVFRLTVLADVEGYAAFYDSPGQALPTRLIVSARQAPTATNTGLRLKTVAHQRPLPTVKHGAMTETILHKRQALQAGLDDILLISNSPDNPLVLETSTANVFGIRDGVLRSSDPVRDGCLPGITRHRILEAAEALRVPVDLSPFSLAELLDCQGVFISNAVSGIRKVEHVDGQIIAWQPSAQRLMDSLSHTVNT
ncbi:aminotransferase class IV [Vampirovibrio chlorellavorus]|uniref:aminotransferase class IV n=1 Tax=Vampirovibrio chlorellavorus TaxID=758823 RepID=UPI0026F1F950|nr:aminotransferase class IV [Vampirovibrio chlorellavorus]